MVCKSLQVEELQIRVDTWKQEVLIWNNYGKIGIKSFLANETKVKKKKMCKMSKKWKKCLINSQKIWTVSEKKNCENLTLSKFSLNLLLWLK